MVDPPKRRLGRGIDSLLPVAPIGASAPDAFRARIEELHPRRSQPRSYFDEQALNELAASLREIGMLEPILVRKRENGGFEIIAGERRWRAAQRAEMREVPVVVLELSDKAAFEAALVENLQREDLNALETSRAFQRLMEDHQHSHESIAKLIGKDRSTVANSLRLLKLPERVLDHIAAQELSEGHGRALLSAADPDIIEKLARQAIAKGWSVRETERKARKTTREAPDQGNGKPLGPNPNTRDLEERLTRALGSKVVIADRKGRGHLTVSFSSYDELDRLINVILK
jgi:ParB family transcriptional regulator, chromosome partitioning protein